jgi:SagB-type dehydrogenase family enzyme
MTISRRSYLAAIGAALATYWHGGATRAEGGRSPSTENFTLPLPGTTSGLSVEQTLARRRSVRAFDAAPLTLGQLSQLLWAAQGTSHPKGFRTAPSAGALYPLELYVVSGDVRGLAQGVYKYQAVGHKLVRTGDGDLRVDTARAALRQSWIANSRAIMVVAAVFRRTMAKYGERGERYVHMEAGHAAQNVYLQATALGLGTTVVGAFDDDQLRALLGMTKQEAPLSLLPLGRLPD